MRPWAIQRHATLSPATPRRWPLWTTWWSPWNWTTSTSPASYATGSSA